MMDSRKRQARKDDAIRRKIEHELSKKRALGAKHLRKRYAPGTVAALRPLEPVTCRPTTTVFEAAQLMLARRENCVLVVDDDQLIGIFTAKDLAFRVVASGLNAQVAIEEIMTPSPLCAEATSPADDALHLMVEKGFRHLPILDKNAVVGVLDITKLYAQQMEKMERVQASSRRLHEALGATADFSHPLHVHEYFEELALKMSGPTLESVLDASPVYTSVKALVHDAAVLMKQHRTTAVLVKDTSGDVAGIFTSKDVVLRVIAANLEPSKCSVVRVMTPQPDTAPKETLIRTALRQMFDGHYLNLPVTSGGAIVGMVDVLRLTYATLSHIRQIEGKDEGPAWSRFWTVDEDSVSELLAPEVTPLELQLFDINPSDSVSAVETAFAFKFRLPLGRVHRVVALDVAALRAAISDKMHAGDWARLEELFAVSYADDEGDIVAITTDADLRDCVATAVKRGAQKADLYVHNADQPALARVPVAWVGAGAGLVGLLAVAALYMRRRPA